VSNERLQATVSKALVRGKGGAVWSPSCRPHIHINVGLCYSLLGLLVGECHTLATALQMQYQNFQKLY